MYKLTQGWPQNLENGSFVNPETNAGYLAWIAEGNTPEPADPIPVPPIIVTPRQIRQALTRLGLRAQVEAAVSVGDQDFKDWWEFSTQVEENHQMVTDMAQLLGIGGTELHALFLLGAEL